MPRTGTELLRTLLDQNARIRIPSVEKLFLPYWVKNWKRFGDLSNSEKFKTLYQRMIMFSYFEYMKEEANLIGEEKWYKTCRDYTLAGVFEALVRHDAKVDFGTNKIWGNKSPNYKNHLTLIKNYFPEAKFIHIIRDVRDYCLSMREAWNKHFLRAAQRWIDSIENAQIEAKNFR